MQHSRPHPRAAFEGYYNKFDLPSGATILIIISEVRNADKHGHSVSLTYVPNTSDEPYQAQHWPQSLEYIDNDPLGGFTLRAPDGSAKAAFYPQKTVYKIRLPDVDFSATAGRALHWSSNAYEASNTPASWLTHLPLPLQWHVHSLGSPADFELRLPASASLPAEDRSGTAVVHQEKNWAHSFPSAHIWVQARRGQRGICMAGGQTLGIMEAFLIGYRDDEKGLEVDMRPPFALRVLGLGVFMSYRVDWPERTFEIDSQNLTHRVKVRAQAPKGTFFPLAAPFSEGHRDNWLGQSMKAKVSVKVWRRAWWIVGAWELVAEDEFEGAALEFGGEYYGARGTDQRRN